MKTNKMYFKVFFMRYLQKIVRFLGLVLIIGCLNQVHNFKFQLFDQEIGEVSLNIFFIIYFVKLLF